MHARMRMECEHTHTRKATLTLVHANAHQVPSWKDSHSLTHSLTPAHTHTHTHHRLEFPVAEGRQAYYLQMEGSAQIEGAHGSETLAQHDAAKVKGKNDLKVTAKGGKAHVLIVELKRE